MKAQTMKQIGTALIVIGLAGAYYTIATMNNRGGVMALDFVREAIWCVVMSVGAHVRGRGEIGGERKVDKSRLGDCGSPARD